MRAVKLKFLIACSLLLSALPLRAADTDLLDSRLDLSAKSLQQPAAVKKLYREAWNIDNKTDLTTVDQLEYFYTHNPGFDQDTLTLMNRGILLMKQMKFGMKDMDMQNTSGAIREEPFLSMVALSNSADGEAAATDILSAADIIPAAENLKENAYPKQKPGQSAYQINVDAF